MFAFTVMAYPFPWSLWQVLFLVAWVLAYRLTATTTHDLEQLLAQSVLDALLAAHLSRKEAANAMGLDEAQFNRQLRGEPANHLSLTRMIRLPFGFWLHFGPSLMLVVARKRWQEIAEDLKIRERA